MFIVQEALLDGPVRIPCEEENLQPGEIVEIADLGNKIICKKSSGGNSFGIFHGYIKSYGLAEVWFDNLIVRTDIYDTSAVYKTGSFLYVNQFGRISSKKLHEDQVPVGRVIVPPANPGDWMEASWI